jgi:hypothetical protein
VAVPSSVVFAALVLAWLVVLVPVVARRRQMVPRPAEADLSARVLRRTAGASMIEEVPVTDTHRNGRAGSPVTSSGAGATAIPVADVGSPADDPTTTMAIPDVGTARPGAATEAATVHRERVLRRAEPVLEDEDDDVYGDDAYDEDDRADAEYDDLEDDLHRDDRHPDDRRPGDLHREDLHREDRDALDREPLDRDSYAGDAADEIEAPSALPKPYRPGRGGFDPDAAAAAAAARYTLRQRVAIGLIAVAVLSALAALVVTPVLWWLHAVADVALLGYLVFLRRQTRIEEEVRARRLARISGERRALEARRERQEEHEARMAALQDDAWDVEYDTDYDPEYDDLEAELEAGYLEGPPVRRWAAPRTPAPPVPADMELVADSEDDPAFHDLEGERVPSYRRAAAGA